MDVKFSETCLRGATEPVLGPEGSFTYRLVLDCGENSRPWSPTDFEIAQYVDHCTSAASLADYSARLTKQALKIRKDTDVASCLGLCAGMVKSMFAGQEPSPGPIRMIPQATYTADYSVGEPFVVVEDAGTVVGRMTPREVSSYVGMVLLGARQAREDQEYYSLLLRAGGEPSLAASLVADLGDEEIT